MAQELDRADHLGTLQIEAASKLDYFTLGVALAICAYLAQTNPYAPLGVNKETFLLLSLIVFTASVICGYLRLEFKVKEMLAYTRVHEAATVADRYEPMQDTFRYHTWGNWTYRLRNALLLLGMICYVITKVGASYQNNGWIPVQ
ncbi:hypothetical protein ACYZTL_06530 [Pseudomonas sp. LB3P81]